MPVIKADGVRYYVAHVPMTPLSQLYLALLSGGFSITNLGARSSEVSGSMSEFEKSVRDQFGINSFAKEGEIKPVAGHLQYATYDEWCHWGPFDFSVAIVRDPMDRFAEAVYAQYEAHLRQTKQRHDSKLLTLFQAKVLGYLQKLYPKNQARSDNLFRPLANFILPQTRLYSHSLRGYQQLFDDLTIGNVDFEEGAVPPLTNAHLIEEAETIFADDIAIFKSLEKGNVSL